ncbi:hypothetical protein BDV26DRAFT_282052 [Aspergillus bertholletiae]|uniref:Uncharacterized protein n=1 Tax=Aspergillus bertholletiae TaxID=1226010 RepID=A0A5N7B708_9EURO|nr:hypothetical protein BDV26DRAFT_282052 [Aspergillus bertholletiae]
MEFLPKGLVSTTRKVSLELDDTNIVDISDVRRLWKDVPVYNTHPSVHEGDIGYRLENFFWRIWSSDRLCGSLSGSTLAKMFQQISESDPISILALQQLKEERLPRAKNESNDKLEETPSNRARRVPLQPILKKSSAPSGDTHKTTRLLLTGLEGQSITRKPSNPPTPVPQSQPMIEDTSRPILKPKAVFVKGKSIKRRPVIMRRKSSQTSSGASIGTQSPQQISKLLTLGARKMPLKQEESSDSEAEAVHIEHVVPCEESSDTINKPPELPPEFLDNLKEILANKGPAPQSAESNPPKWGFVTTDDWTHYDVRYLSAENYEQPSTESLVDKGFRSRFTEQVGLEKEYLATSVGTSSKDGLLQFLQSRSFEIKTSDASHVQPGSTPWPRDIWRLPHPIDPFLIDARAQSA